MALQVAEQSHTSPVYGKCPTLGRCGSCDAESVHTKERIQAEKERNEQLHATGLYSGSWN
jgi:hypothetical protein